MDRTGKGWLPKVLRSCEPNSELAESLAEDAGTILPEISTTRDYPDRILKHYGIKRIALENCFEHCLPPPSRFLEWLIKNPDRMQRKADERSSERTRKCRADLFGDNGSTTQKRSVELALAELRERGTEGSARKWWAFEGFTEVDCFLETDRLLLLVEGKRTELLSSATGWYPFRNQLVRNLEVAQEQGHRRDKHFAVMVLSEDPIAPLTKQEICDSLPHFDAQKRNSLMEHYLGNATWKSVCDATGLVFSDLPGTTADLVACLRNQD